MVPFQKAAVPLLKGQGYVGGLCLFKSSVCIVPTCVLFIHRPMSLILTRFGFDIAVAYAGNGRNNGRVQVINTPKDGIAVVYRKSNI